MGIIKIDFGLDIFVTAHSRYVSVLLSNTLQKPFESRFSGVFIYYVTLIKNILLYQYLYVYMGLIIIEIKYE